MATTKELARLKEFSYRQQAVQQPAPQSSGLWGNAIGGAASNLGAFAPGQLIPANGTDAIASWQTGAVTTENTADAYQAYQLYSAKYKQPQSRMIKFFRVNEEVNLPEGAIGINEPLDELRIKVARWLHN